MLDLSLQTTSPSNLVPAPPISSLLLQSRLCSSNLVSAPPILSLLLQFRSCSSKIITLPRSQFSKEQTMLDLSLQTSSPSNLVPAPPISSLLLQSRLCSSNLVSAPQISFLLLQDHNSSKIPIWQRANNASLSLQASSFSNLVPAPPISSLLLQDHNSSKIPNYQRANNTSLPLHASNSSNLVQASPRLFSSKLLHLTWTMLQFTKLLIPRSSIPPNSQQSSKIHHWNNYYASVSPLIHFLPHTAFVKILNQVANIAIVFPSSCHKIQPTKLKFRYSCCSCSCNSSCSSNSSCSRNGSCSCGLICCSVSIHQTLLLLVTPLLPADAVLPLSVLLLCLKAPHLSSWSSAYDLPQHFVTSSFLLVSQQQTTTNLKIWPTKPSSGPTRPSSLMMALTAIIRASHGHHHWWWPSQPSSGPTRPSSRPTRSFKFIEFFISLNSSLHWILHFIEFFIFQFFIAFNSPLHSMLHCIQFSIAFNYLLHSILNLIRISLQSILCPPYFTLLLISDFNQAILHL